MLKVICSFDSYKPWAGAEDTYNIIEGHDKLDDLEELLEEWYPDGITEDALNDLLWFEADDILDALGIPVERE